MKFNKKLENIIEIAWVDAWLQHTDQYTEDTDSMDEKLEIVELANEFEEKYKGVEFGVNADSPDYYETIWSFAVERLLDKFGTKRFVVNGNEWKVYKGGLDV